MKKILAIILSTFALLPIFANTVGAAFEFPENTPLIVRQNTELLYRELTSFREELLNSSIDLPLGVIYGDISMWPVFGSAEILASFGIGRIVEIETQLRDYNAPPGYYVIVTDINGNSFFLNTNHDGGPRFLWAGTDDQGELLWFYDWDHGSPVRPVEPCWYTRLPRFLHWIFRWVFFGWAWMCC